MERAPLTIASAKGLHHFIVEFAATEEQERRGLMYRSFLPPDQGMLFPYDSPRVVAFWMKNTLIPLDIIFIRADHRIAKIARAKPLSDVPVQSGEPVLAVLEIAGGRASELGIRKGDHVSWLH